MAWFKCGGSGGVASDEVTATLANVLEGKTALTSDSNDEAGTGTLAKSKVLTTGGGTIVTKSATDLSASGKTVTVPAGYYATQATKDVSTGSATTPATTITPANPTITVGTDGKITASVAKKTQSVTPTVSAGYVTSGTAGTITVAAHSNTKQMTVQAAKTVTPATTSQTAVASGTYCTGAITVGAIPNQKSDSGNTKLNATTQTKSYSAGYYANAHGATCDYYTGSVS